METSETLEYSENNVATHKKRSRGRLKRLAEYDTRFWRFSVYGVWVVTALAALVVTMSMPTGIGQLWDMLLMLLAVAIGMALGNMILGFLLLLIRIPIPRIFASSFMLSAGTLAWALQEHAKLDWWMAVVMPLAALLTGAMLGGMIGLLTSRQVSLGQKLLFSAGTFIVITMLCLVLVNPVSPEDEFTVESYQTDQHVEQINAPNPAHSGNKIIDALTYGSGEDQRREEFAEDADLISHTVDASAYLEEWHWLKKKYWGFTHKNLPLNGRIWMPRGEGPFPIVLMVHGNHLMEDHSDKGYKYLGELLASRGTIAISVDENFLNYSSWSDIPDNDMMVRAWLLLKHLEQLQQYNQTEDSPLYRKIDFDRVALLGHSRGGQAVAMAADAERWFDDDPVFEAWKQIDIQGVIALAPTDYSVDGRRSTLYDVSYLVLQGARDGDVNNFYGERQYMRTSFSEGSDMFKASVYIDNANHSRFNSDWGYGDLSLPERIFLNPWKMMDAKDQRQIAKVYVSAFVEVLFHDKDAYLQLFRDYRRGLHWLPEAGYVNRFESDQFAALARFSSSQKADVNYGSTVHVENMKQWEVTEAVDRRGKSKGNRGLLLEWEENGRLTIELSDRFRRTVDFPGNTSLLFSMADWRRDLTGSDEDVVKSVEDDANDDAAANASTETSAISDAADIANTAAIQAEHDEPPLVEIVMELENLQGEIRTIKVNEIRAIRPPPHTAFTLNRFLEETMKGGKYSASTEPVYQTYEIPLADQKQDQFAAHNLARITFYFPVGPGKVMLDDIGFLPSVEENKLEIKN